MDLKQMKRVSIIWGIVLFLIVAGLTVVGFIYKNKSSDYKRIEDELVNVTEKYVEAKFLYPKEKESIRIRLNELQDNGYMEELKKDEDICDGYVLLTNNGFIYEYKGYIKCPKYTTKGYDE